MIRAVDNRSAEIDRLSRLYADKSDEELELIAGTAYDLTDEAQAALKEEVARRKLTIQLNEQPPGYEQPEFRQTVTVEKFRDLSEALFAKGVLEAAGIECYLADDNMARMNWFYANALGGIRLQVRPEQAEQAAAVLEQQPPPTMEIEGDGMFEQPSCPKCQSRDVCYEGLNKPISYTSAWLGFPLPIAQDRWKCNSCGQYWQELPDEAKPEA